MSDWPNCICCNCESDQDGKLGLRCCPYCTGEECATHLRECECGSDERHYTTKGEVLDGRGRVIGVIRESVVTDRLDWSLRVEGDELVEHVTVHGP